MKDNPVDQVVAAGGGGGAPPSLRPPVATEGEPTPAKQPAAPPRLDKVEISAAGQAAAVEAVRIHGVAPAAVQAPSKAPPAEAPREDGSVSINFNKDLGILQAKIVDPVTHEVIREIPPDDVLKMAARIRTFFKERATSAARAEEDGPELLGSGQGRHGDGEEAEG